MLKLWEPFEVMRPFARPALGEMAGPEWARWEPEVPVIDVDDNGDTIVMTVELAGFAPAKVDVTVKGNLLEIVGKHEEVERRYRRFDEFRRCFTLPNAVTDEGIEARIDNGLLIVTMPKAAIPAADVKTVEVMTAPTGTMEKEAK